jgi:hypothetical protein
MPTYDQVHSALLKIPPTEKSLVKPLSLALYLLANDEELKGPLPAQVASILATLNLVKGAEHGQN